MKMQTSLKAAFKGWQEQIWTDTILPGYKRMLRAPRGLPRLTKDRIQDKKKSLFPIATVKTQDFPGQELKFLYDKTEQNCKNLFSKSLEPSCL